MSADLLRTLEVLVQREVVEGDLPESFYDWISGDHIGEKVYSYEGYISSEGNLVLKVRTQDGAEFVEQISLLRVVDRWASMIMALHRPSVGERAPDQVRTFDESVWPLEEKSGEGDEDE